MKKIPTQNIYLCELGVQVVCSKYNNYEKDYVRYRHVDSVDDPIFIWAYKRGSGDSTEFIDIFSGNIYIIGDSCWTNNREFVAVPIRPVIFDSKKVTVAEAKRLFDMTFEDAMIEKLKNYVERYPSFEERIRKEVLLEDTNEINNTKGKIRRLTR